MANTIKIRRSATASAVPTTAQLSLGELAINTYDGKLFLKKSVSGVESIVEVGGPTFNDSLFAIYDNADTTKIAKFDGSGITTGTTVTLTLPNVSATLAHLGNVSQSFAGSVSFNNAAGYFGMSTANSNSTLGGGSTLSGNTKTVLIGSAGASGSTTNISLGSSVSGATSTVTIYGTSFTFGSAGARIYGDMSNATLSSRLWIQTSTTNGATSVFAVPNGTNDTAAWTAFNGADPANAGLAQLRITSGEAAIAVSKNGTGTYLPLAFYVNNAKAFQIGIAGQWGIGATPDYGTAGQVLTSGGPSAAPTWSSVSGGITVSDDTTTNATYYPLIATATSGSQSSAKVSSTKLTFNPSTGALTATSVAGSSDERFKTNWREIGDDFVDMLAGVKHGVYDRTDTDTPVTQVGVSAQSLQGLLPQAVLTNELGHLSVAYGNAALVSAIKLAERVLELERRLASLEATKKDSDNGLTSR